MRQSRRVLMATVFSLCVVLLGGCSSALSGQVVSATTGDPVPRAQVVISESTTMTDDSGSFLMEGLKRGATSGVVKVKGYEDVPFAIELKGSKAATVIEVPDSMLAVAVLDNAVEPKEVAKFRISLDGVEVTNTASFKPVPPGAHALKVEADGRETYESTLTLSPGSNEATASMNLTPLETYKRFYNACLYHRDNVSYLYIHPDERKKMSRKKWTSWGSGAEDKSVKFGDVRMMSKWKSLYLNKTYTGVAEVDRTIVYEVTDSKYSDFGKEYTDNASQHWVKKDGRWYLVHLKGPK